MGRRAGSIDTDPQRTAVGDPHRQIGRLPDHRHLHPLQETGGAQGLGADAVLLLTRRECQHDVAGGRRLVTMEPFKRDDHGRDRPLHVKGAAPVESSIPDQALPRRHRPGQLVHGNGVQVAGEHQPSLRSATRQPSHEIGAIGSETLKLHGDAHVVKALGNQRRRGELAPGRIGRVQAHQ